ncbi:MAG: SpoVA/SpoVAEb family sporulation membrane protein [Bacillota bacterium]|nr:MAG: SpoVA/SpoVAEb family sporulation membrane protein [Bacillota bacterium]
MKADKPTTEAYQRLVKRKAPRPPLLRNVIWAFTVGGAICAVGQVFLGFFLLRGMPLREATVPAAAVMVGLGAFLTGLGVYDEIGKRAGMGAALPITGFANSITSPAMEFRSEGLVLGVGARLFTIAGPVIVWALAVALVVAAVKTLVAGPTGG